MCSLLLDNSRCASCRHHLACRCLLRILDRLLLIHSGLPPDPLLQPATWNPILPSLSHVYGRLQALLTLYLTSPSCGRLLSNSTSETQLDSISVHPRVAHQSVSQRDVPTLLLILSEAIRADLTHSLAPCSCLYPVTIKPPALTWLVSTTAALGQITLMASSLGSSYSALQSSISARLPGLS